MASCGFVAVTVAYCCQNRSEMWSNAKIQKLQIFSVVFTSFDSFISECSIFASILRSSFLSAVIFASSISSEEPIERLTCELRPLAAL